MELKLLNDNGQSTATIAASAPAIAFGRHLQPDAADEAGEQVEGDGEHPRGERGGHREDDV